MLMESKWKTGNGFDARWMCGVKKKKKKNASGGEEIKKEGDFTGKLA